MASTLGLTFDLATGVPVVDNVRPVFTAPREGDVLTAINGAELSKCALTVSKLALLLKALPRAAPQAQLNGRLSLTPRNSRLSLNAHSVLVQVVVTGSPQVSGTSARC